MESRWAFSGTAEVEEEETREKKGEKGIALSRAKVQVVREAAQQMEMAENIPTPKTGWRGKG